MRIELINNELGQRGEALFYVLITRFYGRAKPRFRPQFLGDKWPTVDFIVELMDAGDSTPYFFVQVKTTRAGYTKKERRLKVQVEQEEMCQLASYPAPTYVVGIDERGEAGYIVSANGECLERVSSLSTEYPLNERNLNLLWEEVNDFWLKVNVSLDSSQFIDSKWR
jgi:hypothetical protein